MNKLLCLAITIMTVSTGCQPQQPAALEEAAKSVTDARLLAANGDADNWLTHGRTYNEQRFSPLDQINAGNVTALGLAWHFDLDYDRGVEATPLIVDGVLYVTGPWSIVYALDAASGDLLWKYDPQVPRSWGSKVCCDVVNRGVAFWDDKVYVGTLDGHLVALDAQTGSVVWRVLTVDQSRSYSITGAPRAVKGKIIIGNGGAEYGVRGYVSAYSAETGTLDWRFYTVPGNPAEPFESDALAMAAATWPDGEWWTVGGGGTVWDSIAFDPELDLLYIGVGNGSPWPRALRTPGGGDNLFLSSIVALRPDTGEYVWHYQTTPGDSWDYTATQHMILADISIDGRDRQVLMQAPKNGFFYVLDRANGEFISAENYVPVNWASHIDPVTGRPVIEEDAHFGSPPRFQFPGPLGGHNWFPMAYSPLTGLVYIPAQEIPFIYSLDSDFEYTETLSNLGLDLSVAVLPDEPAQIDELQTLVKGRILAWDPVKQHPAWTIEHQGPGNGGLLATAGNLIFQGKPDGEFSAYSADAGQALWSFNSQTGVVAAPVTYRVNGEQFVAVAAGWGTVLGMGGGEIVRRISTLGKSRLLVFKLGGSDTLPLPAEKQPEPPTLTADMEIDPEKVAPGKALYANNCLLCHGDGAVSGGMVPDLRYSSPEVHKSWDDIVLRGDRSALGMPAFNARLTESESGAIQHFVLSRSRALSEASED